MYYQNVLMFSLLFYYIYYLCSAKMIEGELETQENWVFLSSFCFLSADGGSNGHFEYDISYPKSYAPVNIVLYFDSQWPNANNQSKSCSEKHLIANTPYNQIINLTEFNREFKTTYVSGCKLYQDQDGNNSFWYRCTHYRKFATKHARPWFIVLDNCDSNKGLKLKYNITMVNNANTTSPLPVTECGDIDSV